MTFTLVVFRPSIQQSLHSSSLPRPLKNPQVTKITWQALPSLGSSSVSLSLPGRVVRPEGHRMPLHSQSDPANGAVGVKGQCDFE